MTAPLARLFRFESASLCLESINMSVGTQDSMTAAIVCYTEIDM
jgi:hypothetical protein